MAYSCAYPVEHTFATTEQNYVEYSILLGTEIIYSGRLAAAGTKLTIDIGDICREYIDVLYEDMDLSGNLYETLPKNARNIASVNTFVVSSTCNEGGADKSYILQYDYNTDYRNQLSSSGHLNAPISKEISGRQRVTLSGYDLGGSANVYSYRTSRGHSGSQTITGSGYQLYMVDLSPLGLVDDDTVTLEQSGYPAVTYTVKNSCRGRYALYYVNKSGGLDFLYVHGRAIDSWSVSRTDASLYGDGLNPTAFGPSRYHQQVEKVYQVNTGFLEDANARLIDNLIYTPKVWIQDLEVSLDPEAEPNKNRLKACLVTDSSYQVKERRYDRLTQYTINLKESKPYIRK